MFLEQIKQNREKAFEKFALRKDAVIVNLEDDGYYSYITKKGIKHTFVYFDSFEKYRKSDFYPENPNCVDGFYFVSLI